MADTKVFVVSGDSAIRDSLSELILSAGLRAETFASLETWLAAVRQNPRGCLLLDARARDFTGPQGFARLAAACTRLPVLLLVDRGDVPVAVGGIKVGAVDVLEKPLRNVRVLERVEMLVAAVRDMDGVNG